MAALEELKRHYFKRDQTARRWKETGGKVVGYIGENVPEEMLLAAGFFPLRVTGDPSGNIDLANIYMEPVFHPMVRSLFNRLLDGTYAFLDHLVITNSSDVMVRLFIYLREVRRVEPRPEISDFYFYEFLPLKLRTTALYNRDRTRELKSRLETWIGEDITDDMLRETISVCNENRKLLREVSLLRTEDRPRISGTEALQIIGASMFIQKVDHNLLLRQLLFEEVDQLPRRDGARLYVTGSSLDSTWFYEIVESCEATVVGEDSDLGNRYFEGLVDETIPPLDAIVDRYHLRTGSPSRSLIQERVDYVVSRATEARADGVICFVTEDDDAPAWDYPEQKRALETLGIPTIFIDRQPYLAKETDQLKARIESFVQSISSARS